MRKFLFSCFLEEQWAIKENIHELLVKETVRQLSLQGKDYRFNLLWHEKYKHKTEVIRQVPELYNRMMSSI